MAIPLIVLFCFFSPAPGGVFGVSAGHAVRAVRVSSGLHPTLAVVDRVGPASRIGATVPLRRAEETAKATTAPQGSYGIQGLAAGCLGLAAAWWWGSTRHRRATAPPPMAMMSAVADRGSPAPAGPPPDPVTPRHVRYKRQTLPWSREVLVDMAREFGLKGTGRVAAAWRRMMDDQPLDEAHGPHPLMRQQANFYVEGLRAQPLWTDQQEFPWIPALAQHYQEIRDELIPFDANPSFLWPTAECIGYPVAYGWEWEPLPLTDLDDQGEDQALFPAVLQCLHDAGVPARDAMYARLPPGVTVAPHTDDCNFLLTAHLALKGPAEGCELHVGDQLATWSPGAVTVFDSSFLHESVNTSQEARTILLLRVWHPDLTPVEVQALQYLLWRLEELKGGSARMPVPYARDGYSFRVADRHWKLAKPRFDMRVLPELAVLYDVDEHCYMAGEGHEVLVENGHAYRVELLVPEGYRQTAKERRKEMFDADKWGNFLKEGDVLVADDPDGWESDGGEDDFYEDPDYEDPPPSPYWPGDPEADEDSDDD